MTEPMLWGLLIVNVAWLAINVWFALMNNHTADDNLRQARETAALIQEMRSLARRAGWSGKTDEGGQQT